MSPSALSTPDRATSAPSVGVSREALLGLGQAGRPWAFLEPAARALEQAPMDAGLRFLFARALGELGLSVLALEQIEQLPPGAEGLAEVVSLRDQLLDQPAMLDPHGARLERVRGAVNQLAERAIDLHEQLGAWIARDGAREHHLTADGALVSRERASRDPRTWRWLSDERVYARERADALLEGLAGRPPAPITLVGAAPPCTLLELIERTDAGPHAYSPWIALIEPSPVALLDALAWPGAEAIASDDRVLAFTGSDAVARFETWARGRFEAQALGEVIVSPTLAAPASPDPRSLVERVRADQQEEMRRVHAQVESMYADRGPAWWRSRYEQALAAGATEPLRVLIPTHRHSTYVRHAAEDLRGAFERSGARARVLIEPDDHTNLSNIAYRRTIERFDPDLVVKINYPRATLPGAYPANLPFVCWIQDEMPQLFHSRVGQSQGELDYLCGHLYPRLFDQHGYPRERLLSVPVVADAHKFHRAPITPAQRDRFACEVAFVSHHSETPEQLRDRLIAGIDMPVLIPAMRQLDARVRASLKDAASVSLNGHSDREARALVCEAFAGAPPEGVADRLIAQYLAPLRERLIRHESIAWASEICERRGWRFRLYGRGWENTPEYARFASGELAHGEDLRACYQGAATHLHATSHGLVHQRVMECALSGGLPTCRLTHDTMQQNNWGAMIRLQEHAQPVATKPGKDIPGFSVADDPDAMLWARDRQLLGLSSEPLLFTRNSPENLRRSVGPFVGSGLTPRWLLGDLAETTYTTRDQLERLIELAIERPRRRENLSGGIAARVRARATHDGLVTDLLGLITRSLASA